MINDTVIDPDLVKSVNDTKQPIFIDRFGQQTTKVPDDNYFLEGNGSALYKADGLQTLVDSLFLCHELYLAVFFEYKNS